MNNRVADQSAQMRMLVCAFLFANHEVGFSLVGAHMILTFFQNFATGSTQISALPQENQTIYMIL